MAFDSLALAAVRDELAPRVHDALIQKVVFPDDTSIALETYAPGAGRTHVLLSAHPETGRVQSIEELPRRGVERDSPFALVARKHLRHGRVRALVQPPFERVLQWDIEQRDDDGHTYRVRLIVEAMGRRGNLLLVHEDGAILDALRRTPPSRNPVRPVLPHLRYAPPPPQERLAPPGLSPAGLAEQARGKGGTLATFLAATVAGLSPLAAREVAFRASGQLDQPLAEVRNWQPVLQELARLLWPLATGEWQPTLALSDHRPLAYAPYVLTHLRAQSGVRVASFDTISQAMSAFYTAVTSGTQPRGDPFTSEKRALHQAIDAALSTLRRRTAALERQLAEAADRDPLRESGELILAYQWTLQEGQTSLDAPGRQIPLEPDLTPVENAQRYFARYRKAREAARQVPALLEDSQRAIAHLQELRVLVDLVQTPDALRALRREVADATGREPDARDKRPHPGKAAPRTTGPYRRVPLADGWEALVGASAAGNAAVTFELAGADDLWLHARGVPGAHVILRGPVRHEPPPAILERAAQFAAAHSAARTSAAVEVDYAPRRHVRKIPGAPPGLVRYTHERTIRVSPVPLSRPGEGD